MKTLETFFKNTLLTKVVVVFLLVAGFTSCSKDDEPAPQEIIKSSEKQIISFAFLSNVTSFPTDLVATIDEENNTIEAPVPSDADVSNLLPEIKISKAATIDKTTAQNFSEPVVYTVTAEDGTTSSYTVNVKFTSTQKIALELILEDNPDNELNWDLTNTLDSELGNLDGVTTDGDGKITGLFLDFKNIKVISPEIALLHRLELLKLDGNPITELPVEIGLLTTLIEISLKGTQLTTIPAEIGFLTNLEGLFIEDNPLTILPPEIGLLSKLRRLDVENNQITSLPPEIGFLSNLIFLNLEESNLTEIPMSLAFLTTFNDFIGLSVLPPANIVSQKDALISIYSANPGNTLDWGVDNFPDVDFDANDNPTGLRISNKNLTRLPDFIGVLTSLDIIIANNNNIEEIPTSLGILNLLEVLEFGNNKLNTVPSELGQLNNLELMNLTNNPITNIPAEVCNLQIANGGLLTIISDAGEGCN